MLRDGGPRHRSLGHTALPALPPVGPATQALDSALAFSIRVPPLPQTSLCSASLGGAPTAPGPKPLPILAAKQNFLGAFGEKKLMPRSHSGGSELTDLG